MRFVIVLISISVCCCYGADDPSEVRVFISALKDKDPAIRKAAVLAISKNETSGVSAAPYLVEAADDADPNVRLAAVKALGALQSESALAVRTLIKHVEDTSGAVRIAACKALGATGKPAAAAVPVLIRALATEDVNLRFAAISALGKVATDAESVVPPLLGILRGDRCDLSEVALDAIGTVDSDLNAEVRERVILAAADQIQSPCRDTQISALSVMKDTVSASALSTDLLSMVMSRADDKDEDIRYEALQVLEKVDSPRAVEIRTSHATKDPDYLVRSYVIESLNSDDDVDQIAALMEGLGDPAGAVRAKAVDKLGAAKFGRRQICTETAGLANDPEVTVRRNVAERLSMCIGGPAEAFAALFSIAHDRDAKARASALSSIGSVFGRNRWQAPEGEPTALPGEAEALSDEAKNAILEHIDDPDAEVRTVVAQGFLKIAPFSDRDLGNVVSATRSEYADMRHSAIEVLASFGRIADDQTPYLLELLKDGDPAIRSASLEALGLISRDPLPIHAALTAALDDDSGNVGASAAVSLGRFGERSASAAGKIVSKVGSSESEDAAALYWALAEIGKESRSALNAAVQIAKSEPSPKPRSALAVLLGSLTGDPGTLDKAVTAVSDAMVRAELQLRTLDGRPEKVTAGGRNVVIAMATWCPHSKALAQLLKNENIKRLTQGWTFNFVFGDEWPHIRNVLEEQVTAGDLSSASLDQKLQELRSRAGNGEVYDPKFFVGLPGNVYFSSGIAGEPSPESFPSVFVPVKNKYALDASSWASESLRLPAWILENVHW